MELDLEGERLARPPLRVRLKAILISFAYALVVSDGTRQVAAKQRGESAGANDIAKLSGPGRPRLQSLN